MQILRPAAATHAYDCTCYSLVNQDLLLQAIRRAPLSSTMSSPGQAQDTDTVLDISVLPADLRRQTAAWVEHSSLPALRLVSRGWYEAANLAVRQLKRHELLLWPAQVLLIGQSWPNLERLDLVSGSIMALPASACRSLISSLLPLTRLQHLSLSTGAALLPESQDLMFRQTRLLSLRTVGIHDGIGVSDGLLQLISRLSHLTRLECDLQGEPQLVSGYKLEPATNKGVRCLSSLQTLQDLTLTVHNFYTLVTGEALSSIGSLHQLTHLSLRGWPIKDTDLSHLAHLQLHSLDLNNCMSLSSD